MLTQATSGKDKAKEPLATIAKTDEEIIPQNTNLSKELENERKNRRNFMLYFTLKEISKCRKK